MRPQDYFPSDQPDTQQLIARRRVVQAQVYALFKRFLSHKRTELGEFAFDRLSGLDIYAIPNELRTSISRLRLLMGPGFDSAPYWGMIDAAGALADSQQGRWPYMGVQERELALNHALEFIAQVESGIILSTPAVDDADAAPNGPGPGPERDR